MLAGTTAYEALQVDLARSLLEHYNFQEIIWTDTDVVWLRSPLAFFASHPTADMAIQTDCLSHFVETEFTEPFSHGFARCGHMPGNGFNNAFNTGMILLRNRPATHGFLEDWLDYLLDSNRMYVDVGGGQKAIVGDQLAFNTLMTRQSTPWISVNASEDWRVVWGHDKTVKVLLLCMLLERLLTLADPNKVALGAHITMRQPSRALPSTQSSPWEIIASVVTCFKRHHGESCPWGPHPGRVRAVHAAAHSHVLWWPFFLHSAPSRTV